MTSYIQGETIKELRTRRGLTQRQLAERIGVTDKAVSKWESGRGLPDITLLEPLAAQLGVSIAELLNGEAVRNANRSGNMLRTAFYVCPVCGNVIHATGEGSFSCCGVSLPRCEPEDCDADHALRIETVEYDHLVTVDHPMTKDHYISFVAYLTSDRVHFRKLYPEQEALARFPKTGRGMIVAYCNKHGLYRVRV